MDERTAYVEPTMQQLERDAQELRICSGFKVSIDDARDRVCEGHGWVTWDHMARCKAKRGAQ